MTTVEAPAYRDRMTERQWQALVVEAATLLGWSCYHTEFSVRSTPGFPDLVCAKPGRLVALELKSERGKPTEHQLRWIGLFGSVPGVVAMVARPSDWEAVERVLREGGEG